ncbi:MAG: AsnC family transcriptional regulator [Sulfolobales archaeon]|nr:AsnC family transcriptional regulator [Sulfolobales archaeon]MCX8199421.1 AsnC family transcriptional regulator [Sulfolobales archaeon]MDW8170264.1 AsnC family transcriptional regulator [Desulfurococcaceae archaeon]
MDLTIIKELMENSRKSFRDIAKSLKLSDVAVIKRVKKLESSGVIRKYTIIVDPFKLGFMKISFTGINVKPEKMFEVIMQLKEKDFIKYIAITTGDHEVIAIMWASDSDELRKYHEEIKRIDGVIDIYPAILTDVVKNEAYI